MMRHWVAAAAGSPGHVGTAWRVFCPAACCCAAITAAGTGRPPAPAAPPALRVLFVGNSYTGYGDIPRSIAHLVNTNAAGLTVQTDACLLGGANMKMHFERKADNPLERISTGRYDWVVLQGGASPFLPDRQQIMREYMPKLIAVCRAHNAIPILACPWSTARTLDGIKTQIAFYKDIRTNHNVALVPLAEAWLRVLKEQPQFGMYVDTTGHPSI